MGKPASLRWGHLAHVRGTGGTRWAVLLWGPWSHAGSLSRLLSPPEEVACDPGSSPPCRSAACPPQVSLGYNQPRQAGCPLQLPGKVTSGAPRHTPPPWSQPRCCPWSSVDQCSST